MAAESGIDLRSINGSGPGGRIIKRDVEGLISQSGAARQPDKSHLRGRGQCHGAQICAGSGFGLSRRTDY